MLQLVLHYRSIRTDNDALGSVVIHSCNLTLSLYMQEDFYFLKIRNGLWEKMPKSSSKLKVKLSG